MDPNLWYVKYIIANFRLVICALQVRLELLSSSCLTIICLTLRIHIFLIYSKLKLLFLSVGDGKVVMEDTAEVQAKVGALKGRCTPSGAGSRCSDNQIRNYLFSINVHKVNAYEFFAHFS